MPRKEFEGLIFDLGMSEGNDTAYYLSKGFKVVGVEADTSMCAKVRIRFADEISSGALIVLNYAVARHFGYSLQIYSNAVHQGVSGINKRGDVPDDYTKYDVPTIDWRTLVAQQGVPRYLKMDVEGSESPFLESMVAQADINCLPEFISVECYQFANVEYLHRLGYRRFTMVDQHTSNGFTLPTRQFEGVTVQSANFIHSSGPFGLDLFFETGWSSFEEVKLTWPDLQATHNRTWHDCHAWRPN